MKTLDQIKKALECCASGDCQACPYEDYGDIEDCTSAKAADVFAHIQQLERERDAAITDLREAVQRGCWSTCKHGPANAGNNCRKADYICARCREDCVCKLCEIEGTKDFYEWRGVKEE